jgi:taurine dioxygenase
MFASAPAAFFVAEGHGDQLLGICRETGQTYARKYDCALLEGATVLSPETGFGLTLPACDLSRAGAFTAHDIAALRAVIQDARGVLVFSNQQELTPQQHVAFAARFGEVERHMVAKGLPDCPEVLEIVRERGATIIFGEEWHSDHSFQPVPASLSFLRATAEVTPYGTNNTEFAHCEAAWDALSPAMRALLLPLDAYHSAGKAYGDGAKYGKKTPNSREAMGQTSTMAFAVEQEADIIGDVAHPVVVRHPETGRDALFISETFTNGIVGMTAREGLELTQLIQRHVTQPQFRVEVAYEPHQVAMWDNRQLIHRGLANDNSARRVIQRASVAMAAPPKATRDFL